MPIEKDWSSMSKENISEAPEEPGVYELRSFGSLVYIGAAENIKESLREQMDDRNPNKFRCREAGYKFFVLKEDPKGMKDKELSKYKVSQKYDKDMPSWNKNEQEAN